MVKALDIIEPEKENQPCSSAKHKNSIEPENEESSCAFERHRENNECGKGNSVVEQPLKIVEFIIGETRWGETDMHDEEIQAINTGKGEEKCNEECADGLEVKSGKGAVERGEMKE